MTSVASLLVLAFCFVGVVGMYAGLVYVILYGGKR